MLIVLDNFEQIVDAAPTIVRCTRSRRDAVFLVTSRIVLRIRGERVYEVPTLAVNGRRRPRVGDPRGGRPAVELFVERARAVKPDFARDAVEHGGGRRDLPGLDRIAARDRARRRTDAPADPAAVTAAPRHPAAVVDSNRDVPSDRGR